MMFRNDCLLRVCHIEKLFVFFRACVKNDRQKCTLLVRPLGYMFVLKSSCKKKEKLLFENHNCLNMIVITYMNPAGHLERCVWQKRLNFAKMQHG